jgi:glycolate oxidase iron-sulfur subunit
VTPEKILAETDRCVKCGYCLPHCPTYTLSSDEGESPRGRIALIQALAEGVLSGSHPQEHLNHCLVCRACEPACPSGVRYSHLIAAARELGHQSRPVAASTTGKLALTLLSSLPYHSWFQRALRLYDKTGLRRLARRCLGQRFRNHDNLLPETPASSRWRSNYSPEGNRLACVILFTGCVGRITNQPTLLATIKLLNRLGVEVLIPPKQRCCGAMHFYEGDKEKAQRLAEANQRAFSGIEADAIITTASGCGAHLAEYGNHGNMLPMPVLDISSYLLQLPQLNQLRLRPLKQRVAVHTPCSLKNVLKGGDAPFRLLEMIPQLELFPLPDNGLCCGGAGLQLLSQPETAAELRVDKLQAVRDCRPDILVTSNTGCSLHLGAGVHKEELSVEVLHPVELLARQI